MWRICFLQKSFYKNTSRLQNPRRMELTEVISKSQDNNAVLQKTAEFEGKQQKIYITAQMIDKKQKSRLRA